MGEQRTAQETELKRQMVADTAPHLVADAGAKVGNTFNAHDPANDLDAPKTDAELRAERMTELETDDDRFNMQRAQAGDDTSKNNMVSAKNDQVKAQTQAQQQSDKNFTTLIMIQMQTRYDDAMGKLKDRMDGLENLMELIRNGELDFNNPDHIRKLKQHGHVEDIEAFKALSPEEQLAQMEQEYQGASKIFSKSKDEWEKGNHEAAIENAESATKLKASMWQSRHDIETEGTEQTYSNHIDSLAIDKHLSDDTEIERFVKGMDDAAKIANPLERLQKQEELVQNLSEDGGFQMSFDPDYQDFFEDGYFDQQREALEKTSVAAQSTAPTPVC